MMETVVEVSTECGPIEEESFPIPPDCEPAAKKKRGSRYPCCTRAPFKPAVVFSAEIITSLLTLDNVSP